MSYAAAPGTTFRGAAACRITYGFGSGTGTIALVSVWCLYEYLLHNARRLVEQLSADLPLGGPQRGRAWLPVHLPWFSSGAYMNTHYTMRGGSWLDFHGRARCAYRLHSHPGYRDFDFGFRLVLT